MERIVSSETSALKAPPPKYYPKTQYGIHARQKFEIKNNVVCFLYKVLLSVYVCHIYHHYYLYGTGSENIFSDVQRIRVLVISVFVMCECVYVWIV